MITIEQFDAAYRRYFQDYNPNTEPSSALHQPLKQFEDTIKLVEEGDPRYSTNSHAFMFFYVRYTNPPNGDPLNSLSFDVVKQVVSKDGTTSLPEFLNDYISLD